jgi:hypothetical protein
MAHVDILSDILSVGINTLHSFPLLSDHMRQLREDLAELCDCCLYRFDCRRALLDVGVLKEYVRSAAEFSVSPGNLPVVPQAAFA